ncbi:hypothetical protein F4777DRAFT_527469 [Nemania sp. FL0916]|nr:hypothetical protein F4777DRAFT_527469 [Nemania sp. FL0916]
MSWTDALKTVGGLALWPLQLVVRLLYLLSTPLRWLLYSLYASAVFLLSPVWAIFNLALGAAKFGLNLVVGLKGLYTYLACAAIIGVCAGCMLHGTSSAIFVLLGYTTPGRRKLGDQYPELPPTSRPLLDDEVQREDGKELSRSPSGSSYDRRHVVTKVDTEDLFEKRWKLLRSPEQPRRRRRGLIGQTIHEESSESDVS